jgi:hypothetical protein
MNCTCKPNELGYHERGCALVDEMLRRRPTVYLFDGEIEGGVIYVIDGNPADLWVEVDGWFALLHPQRP